MTYDRGSELACHAELSKRLNIDIWFADPHAPWQRGSIYKVKMNQSSYGENFTVDVSRP